MRKAALGLGIGAVLMVVLYVGRGISDNLSGMYWPIRPMKLNFRDMDKKLGDDWNVVQSSDLPSDVFEALGAKDAEVRTYQNSNNNTIYYHGSVFDTFHIGPAHTPLHCYPAQGWTLIHRKVVEIPLPDGTIFKPTLLSFEKRDAKVLVLFWFQFGNFVVVNHDEQRTALDYYRPDKQWPCLFKGMLHMPVSSRYHDAEPLKELAGYIYEYTRTLQEGKAPAPTGPKR